MLKLLVCALLVGSVVPATVPESEGDALFLNRWAVKIHGGEGSVREVVKRHGFEYVTSVFGDWHVVRARGLAEKSPVAQYAAATTLMADDRVVSVEQQKVSQRFPKDLDVQDERFEDQWYMYSPEMQDINVIGAWEQCASGKGVNIAFVDDGLALENQDIAPNLNEALNLDAYTNGELKSATKVSHGTKCAGMAAAASNDFCGLGVAYNANISGIRVLGGEFTDEVDGRGLAHKQQEVDIYSCSYGPSDNGNWMEPLGTLAAEAIQNGATKGRNGKGNIYVYATGNGGTSGDSCTYDPYIQSPYTIGVGGVKQTLEKLYGGEFCTSTMVASYTQDTGGTIVKYVTTDFGADGCVDNFSGTSASTPQVSGAIANALQANPNLSNRDVQHLLALTSNPDLDFEPSDFVKNQAGYKVSGNFGFGLLDAGKLVEYAKRWSSVSPVHRCTISIDEETSLPNTLTFEVTEDYCGCNIQYLEHVSVYIDAEYCVRGNLAATLTSPHGTESLIYPGRPYDWYTKKMEWAAMSHSFWGENPYPNKAAKWTFNIFSRDGKKDCSGTLRSAKLILRGMAENPADFLGESPLPGSSTETCTVTSPNGPTTTEAPSTQATTEASTVPSTTQKPDSCTSEYRKYQNVKFSDPTDGSTVVGMMPTADMCQYYCDINPACLSYSFSWMTRLCTTHTKNLWSSPISLDEQTYEEYFELICTDIDAVSCMDRFLSYGDDMFLDAPAEDRDVVKFDTSISECEAICSLTPGCLAINWESSQGSCEVVYRSPKTANVVSKSGYQLHYELCGESVQDTDCEASWDGVVSGMKLFHPGLPAVELSDSSEDECESACEEDQQCLGYNFYNDASICHLLYFSMDGGGQLIQCDGACMYRRKRCAVSTVDIDNRDIQEGNLTPLRDDTCTGEFRMYDGMTVYDYMMEDTDKGLVPRYQTCQRYCESEPTCVALSYNNRKTTCVLHSKNQWHPFTIAMRDDDVTYSEIICTSVDEDDCLSRYLAYGEDTFLDAPESDRDLVLFGTTESICELLCTRTEGCLAVNYETTQGSCEVVYRSPKTANVISKTGYRLKYKLCGEAARKECVQSWDLEFVGRILFQPALPAVDLDCEGRGLCQNLCLDDENCLGYNFYLDEERCTLLYFSSESGGGVERYPGDVVYQRKRCSERVETEAPPTEEPANS